MCRASGSSVYIKYVQIKNINKNPSRKKTKLTVSTTRTELQLEEQCAYWHLPLLASFLTSAKESSIVPTIKNALGASERDAEAKSDIK